MEILVKGSYMEERPFDGSQDDESHHHWVVAYLTAHRLFFIPALLDKIQRGDSSKANSLQCDKRWRLGALMAVTYCRAYHVMSYALGLNDATHICIYKDKSLRQEPSRLYRLTLGYSWVDRYVPTELAFHLAEG